MTTPKDSQAHACSKESLDALRRQIDQIDQQIVELLGRRQKAVEDVVAIKKKYQLPIYHPAREADVVTNRRSQGGDAGLNPDFVEELFRAIMQQSRKSQAAKMHYRAVRENVSVLVVGGKGQMGRYFAERFENSGYRVRVLDQADWPRAQTLCRDVELALLAVPIGRTGKTARQLAPYLPAECLLADITSIKQAPVAAMLQAHPGPVIGLHPLFGPSARSLDKQTIIATPGRQRDACQWLLDQLTAWGAVVVTADAQEHDRVMQIVQALRHFSAFAFGRFLFQRNVDLARSLEFSSPIYRLELGMVGRLFAQDPQLYAEIIFASPECLQVLQDYAKSLTQNLQMLQTGDKEAFVQAFRQVANWFGPFGDQAMRESNYLVEKLIERF